MTRPIALWAYEIIRALVAPDRWIDPDPDTGASGPTIPYTGSHATAAAVLAGDTIAGSREQIVAEFALTHAAPYLPVEGDFEDPSAQTATELHAVITGNALPNPQLARLLQQALEHQIPPARLRATIPTRATAPIPGTDF
jgi:hypothetical protein